MMLKLSKNNLLLLIGGLLLAFPGRAQNPPETWQEHWFEHEQIVSRVYYDNDLAVYFDDDVDRSYTWMNEYLGDVWRYTKDTYGKFSEEGRLYAVFHAGKYSGGHPSTYFDESHDFRDVIDVGSSAADAWNCGCGNELDLTTHEVAHIVEGASMGVHESPAFGIWRDSKWAEIFNYDVYRGLGRTADAERWYDLMMNTTDDFPREGTQWFKDWFFPIYDNYGETQVLVRFFTVLSENFPISGDRYAKDMNWGEFVHFWSGAADTDLKALATDAFGWSEEWEGQWLQARRQYRLPYDTTDVPNGPDEPTGRDITGSGSTITTQFSDSPDGEGVANLIDDNEGTKFLTFNPATWVQLETDQPYTVSGYSLTSGNDAEERDPLNWTLEASNDTTTWTTLDSRSDENFLSRIQRRTFSLDNDQAYSYYRFNFSNNGGASFQLSELELFEAADSSALPPPPDTIVDGIRPDNPVVTLSYYDDEIAVYFGEGMNPTVDWMNGYIKEVWHYMQQTYGSFGPDPRIYVVAHKNPAYNYATINNRFDAGFGYRNVIDLGGVWDWENPEQVNYEVITHELAHIVEGASKNTKESPSFTFWGDGPWPEIFIYDVYQALGRDAWAQDWFERLQTSQNSHYGGEERYYFFRDWFYPIYEQYGGAGVFDRYFTLLSEYFPKKNITVKDGQPAQEYAKRASFGEVLHFMSGAAGTNLKDLYTEAFGWSEEREAEWMQARSQYRLPYDTIDVVEEKTGRDITGLGGTITAEFTDSPDGEGVTNLIDDEGGTKYLTFNPAAWVQFQADQAYVINGYSLTSGNDAEERDPLSWTLKASNDSINWTTLDSLIEEDFPFRIQRRTFSIDDTQPYLYYRFTFSNNEGTLLQLSELELFDANDPALLRAPDNPDNVTSGLTYSYYEGNWDALPDFSTLTALAKASSPNVDLSLRKRNNYFAMLFEGYVEVPTDGQYTFYTESDDGSQLWIGDSIVVDNDGLHAAREARGTLGLTAGKHAIKIGYFERRGKEVLQVRYEGPGIDQQAMPDAVLFRVLSDSIAPTVPATLEATEITQDAVNLRWGASSDNVAVQSYRVYQDDQFLLTTADTLATVTGLLADTEYRFAVSAVDSVGNESAPASLTVTTRPEGTEEKLPFGNGTVRIYPNPFEQDFTISLTGDELRGPVGVVVFNLQGRIVAYGKLKPEQHYTTQISLPNQPAGIYVVTLFGYKVGYVGRVEKQ